MRKNSGITLVALVVTVIILLILAVVAISMISGNDGLFTKANEAATLYNEEARKEAEWLQQLMDSEYLGGTGSAGSSTGNPTAPTIPTINGPLSDGSYDNVKKMNKPDVSKLPMASTSYVIWQDNGNGTYSEKVTDLEPTAWYDYTNGKWANILSTGNGLKAYWVWIPRFAYKLPENGRVAKEIDVIFVKDNTKTGVLADGTETTCYYSTDTEITSDGSGLYASKTADAKDKWIIHPAFWWDNNSNGIRDAGEELNGIWFAKFEPSDYRGKVEVIPGVASWRDTVTSNSFNVTRAMQDTGGVIGTTTGTTTIDTHMAKNMEWAAVSLLGQSKYGIFNPKSATRATENGGDGTLRVWTNPNTSYITGKVTNTAYSSSNFSSTADAASIADANCIRYNMLNGPKGSTTGTVYGVYDMSGGAWEQVMGVMVSSANATTPMTSSTGFTTWPDSKYYDLYPYGTSFSDYTRGKIGDLTSELSPTYVNSKSYSWNDDTALFVYSSYPIFYRGASYNYGVNSGTTAFAYNNGANSTNHSFRPVLLVF